MSTFVEFGVSIKIFSPGPEGDNSVGKVLLYRYDNPSFLSRTSVKAHSGEPL